MRPVASKSQTDAGSEIAEFKELLGKFGRVSPRHPPRKTFLEICGFPHHENISSNILEFLLSPGEGHGLSPLILDVLLELAGRPVKNLGAVTEVEREVITQSGNRLDLVIETDNLLIGIENKILADLYNDFEDYSNFLSNRAGKRPFIGILLTLRDLDSPHALFTPVTYGNLFETLLNRLGPHLVDRSIDQRAISLLTDLIMTLSNLKKEAIMNPAFFGLIKENSNAAIGFFNQMLALQKEFRSKVKEVQATVTEKAEKVGTWRSWAQDEDVCESVFFEFRINKKLSIGIGADLYFRGWEVYPYVVDGNDDNEPAFRWIEQHRPKGVASLRLSTFEFSEDHEAAKQLQLLINIVTENR